MKVRSGNIVVLSEALAPDLAPRYRVRVERRVYVESKFEDSPGVIRPDVVGLEEDQRRAGSPPSRSVASTIAAPVMVQLPMPERLEETFLTIRERETLRVVTVVELLSPANKRPGSEGRREYLRKRGQILDSDAHLVELDLLRGGVRLPMRKPLPPSDYYALVSREERRPRAEVYPWSLRQALPHIPIPLAGGDPDLVVDLQAVFTTVYDRALYRHSLDDRAPIGPPLTEEDASWAQAILLAAGLAVPAGPAP